MGKRFFQIEDDGCGIDASSPEATLVRAAKSGSARAFHHLADRYHARVYRMVFFRVRARMDAEDITQKRLELEALAEMEPLDEAALMDRYRKLDEARTKMGIERFRFLIEVRKIVDLQGYRQLLELRKAVKERRAHSNRQPKAEPMVQ